MKTCGYSKEVRRSRGARTNMKKLPHRSYANLRIIKSITVKIHELAFSIGVDAAKTQECIFYHVF